MNHKEHKAQVFHYLKSTAIPYGLLVNFGAYKFEIQKYVLGASETATPLSLRSL